MSVQKRYVSGRLVDFTPAERVQASIDRAMRREADTIEAARLADERNAAVARAAERQIALADSSSTTVAQLRAELTALKRELRR